MTDKKIQQAFDNTWYSIATAPKDGTIIMGIWQNDTFPKPYRVRYLTTGGWYYDLENDNTTWRKCTAPTHWQPIN